MLKMRARFASLTRVVLSLFSTIETAVTETPARLAMSESLDTNILSTNPHNIFLPAAARRGLTSKIAGVGGYCERTSAVMLIHQLQPVPEFYPGFPFASRLRTNIPQLPPLAISWHPLQGQRSRSARQILYRDEKPRFARLLSSFSD